ncbi:MAG TPA: hypothetical protein VM165_16665 [Planctomycetaceae bacterium]|nr:hypothetical protein [Planctomycetaceae bacterium]
MTESDRQFLAALADRYLADIRRGHTWRNRLAAFVVSRQSGVPLLDDDIASLHLLLDCVLREQALESGSTR